MTPRRTKLIQLRHERKLKQQDVAEAVGVTTSFYGMIEVGTRTPKLGLAKKIADYFGVCVEDIFFEPGQQKVNQN